MSGDLVDYEEIDCWAGETFCPLSCYFMSHFLLQQSICFFKVSLESTIISNYRHYIMGYHSIQNYFLSATLGLWSIPHWVLFYLIPI